jgi:hypothetical protein
MASVIIYYLIANDYMHHHERLSIIDQSTIIFFIHRDPSFILTTHLTAPSFIIIIINQHCQPPSTNCKYNNLYVFLEIRICARNSKTFLLSKRISWNLEEVRSLVKLKWNAFSNGWKNILWLVIYREFYTTLWHTPFRYYVTHIPRSWRVALISKLRKVGSSIHESEAPRPTDVIIERAYRDTSQYINVHRCM